MKKLFVFGAMFFLAVSVFAKAGTGLGIPKNATKLDKIEKTYEEIFKTGKDSVGLNKSNRKVYTNVVKHSITDYKKSRDTVKK